MHACSGWANLSSFFFGGGGLLFPVCIRLRERSIERGEVLTHVTSSGKNGDHYYLSFTTRATLNISGKPQRDTDSNMKTLIGAITWPPIRKPVSTVALLALISTAPHLRKPSRMPCLYRNPQPRRSSSVSPVSV